MFFLESNCQDRPVVQSSLMLGWMACILIEPDKGAIYQYEKCRSSLVTREYVWEVVTLARIWKAQWETS